MILSVEKLRKRFGKNEILKGIDFSVDEGQVVGVIGSSGSGKSTLLRCIDFLERPDEGHITLMEQSFDVKQVTRSQILYMRRNTAMVFQQFHLFRYKTALENVMEGLTAVQKMPKAEARALAEKQLEDVGLSDRMDYYPRQLSGGQQQRVAIARAVVAGPKLILADEPTGNLDSKNGKEVMDLLKELNAEGTTIVMVTHSQKDAGQAQRTIDLFDGQIVSDVKNEL